ncbi:hypothetical protein SDC9_138931 [bioreactor metagenome]|uniref:Uncharacterized protein n=1 Tax=bioreactor metagenome TaxID=1076179 RepID=A0A645DR40_9ZZZZ
MRSLTPEQEAELREIAKRAGVLLCWFRAEEVCIDPANGTEQGRSDANQR